MQQCQIRVELRKKETFSLLRFSGRVYESMEFGGQSKNWYLHSCILSATMYSYFSLFGTRVKTAKKGVLSDEYQKDV